MPAVSKAQQKLMGMAYALKKGEMKKSEASQEVQDLADSMTLKQLKDFAETSHENLPERKAKEVDEYNLGVNAAGPFFWYTQAGQAAVQKVGMENDRKDPLIQSFMDFIDGKKNDKVDEGDFGVAMAASPSNVPGMGNVAPPTSDQTGSGDIFGSDDEDDDPNRKIGIMSYEQYKKWIKKWQKQKDQAEQQSKK
jgi:hypothetical protein